MPGHPFFDSFTQLARGFRDWLFPPICLHCSALREDSSTDSPLCPTCQGQLRPFPAQYVPGHILDRLSERHIDNLWIAFELNAVARLLIHQVKYEKMPQLGVQLGKLSAHQLKNNFQSTDGDLIPIPLHPLREKEREYNQSKKLAQGVASEWPLAVRTELLLRRRHTSSQTKLNREERSVNVADAFDIRQGINVTGKCFILIDDVVTTGATMNECARVLKQGGASRVSGCAFASPLREEFWI